MSLLGKVLRTTEDTTVTDGEIEAKKVYRLHERGVSYSTMKRKVGATKWTSSSTSEVPLPAPLMAMVTMTGG